MKFDRFFKQDKKLLIKVIAGVVLLVVAFAFYFLKDTASENDMLLSEIPGNGIDSNEESTVSAIDENAMIVVDVAGAVINPSVVELPLGSRVYEAIDLAGGLTENADTRATNQAELLTDGQKVYIPTENELEENSSSNSNGVSSYSPPLYAGTSQSGLININTADSDALQQLTGVGPATAEKIINYRNENGKFTTIEDIKNVSGIGDKTFEKFKDKITV